jgi:hypothetical protein
MECYCDVHCFPLFDLFVNSSTLPHRQDLLLPPSLRACARPSTCTCTRTRTRTHARSRTRIRLKHIPPTHTNPAHHPHSHISYPTLSHLVCSSWTSHCSRSPAREIYGFAAYVIVTVTTATLLLWAIFPGTVCGHPQHQAPTRTALPFVDCFFSLTGVRLCTTPQRAKN